jgi:hypothetical protein
MRKSALGSFLTFIFLFTSIFAGPVKKEHAQQLDLSQSELVQYYLPNDHFLHKKLERIVTTTQMFDGPEELRSGGFDLSDHYGRGLMVAWHPEISGYIIKKFINTIPVIEQLENYVTRIRGSRTIRQFIEGNHITQIVVPRKWLYLLPEKFFNPETGEPSYLLIAERIDILDTRHTKELYSSEMPRKLLREFVAIITRFRGLDSTIDNMPFTKEHKIAFIDLHKWQQEWRPFLKVVRDFMLPNDIKYAKKQYRLLKKKQRGRI